MRKSLGIFGSLSTVVRWQRATLASAEKEGSTHYVPAVLCHSFQLLESRAQHALRENNGGADFADLVLEEEELPF